MNTDSGHRNKFLDANRSNLRIKSLWLGFVLTSTAFAAAPVAFDWFEYTGRDDIFTTPLPAGSFRNPILAGFYPDPSVCRVPGKSAADGDDYYLVNSTFAYFPGIPVFHSRDLVHWTQLGHVIDRPAQLRYDGLGVTRGLFAPTINYHDGTFYVLCTMVDGGGNFLVTANDPAGPWSDPIWLHFDGIDPSLCFASDGRAWLVNNGNPPDNKPLYSGHRAIWIQEFDVAAKKLTGPRSIIVNGGADIAKKPVWIEGPHLFQRGVWYYLCCAEGGTSDQHSQVILRSKSPAGPFVAWEKNPILTQRDLDGTAPHAVTCTGHAELFVGPDGNWWATFLGCRPFAGKYWTTGRETFLLPVTWTDDGWPVILAPGARVPYVVPAPRSKVDFRPPLSGSESGLMPAPPLSGNFTWRDDFSAEKLSPLWIMLRAPQETWWSVDSAAGQLRLTPRAEPLSGKGNPAFLARRLQHARFDVTTSLIAPTDAGVSAGLVAFQNETHYYFLGMRHSASGEEIFLERANGKTPEIIATAKITATAKLELRITGEEKFLTFAYALAHDHSPASWQTLVADADVAPITVQAAGGGLHFTGAVVGLHARLGP